MTGHRNEGKVRAALDKAWLNSRSDALSRLAVLESLLDQLRSGRSGKECVASALSAAHRLSGSLGMFGMGEASSCAAKIEALLCHQSAPDVAVMAGLVSRLRNLMEEAPPARPPEDCDK